MPSKKTKGAKGKSGEDKPGEGKPGEGKPGEALPYARPVIEKCVIMDGLSGLILAGIYHQFHTLQIAIRFRRQKWTQKLKEASHKLLRFPAVASTGSTPTLALR
ncbi:hypothetical protein CLIM01_06493 [Colletotrichum limetticola]|uniref:Uncharacterized protein n=1 Tax=Colletotrichum limetticola TaxID=1209924 RepID=A0ABQ9PX54_9PEZI|nr:hypothetical protein CLIM01_06493 [Colletotrichum limetticola]